MTRSRSSSRGRSRHRSQNGSRVRRARSRSRSRLRRQTRSISRSRSRDTPRGRSRSRDLFRRRSRRHRSRSNRNHRRSRVDSPSPARRRERSRSYRSREQSRSPSRDRIRRQYQSRSKSPRRNYKSKSSFTPPRPIHLTNSASIRQNKSSLQPSLTPPRQTITTTTTVNQNTDARGPSIDSAARCSETSTLAHAIVEAIKSAQPVRSNKYFVSNFDPTINSIDAWCDEVERARTANGWSDHECLSRVALCLKGDAKVWLTEWITNDRTWSNFKREFKPLCPGKLDYANILLDAMKATSDQYTTYAEYARRTLLRLRIVQGLSDELRTLIVIRGIDSPQVRAAAANAALTSETLVSFLSIYVKSKLNKPKQDNRSQSGPKSSFQRKQSRHPEIKCFSCGQMGHFGRDCKNKKTQNFPQSKVNTNAANCSFCKKPGHTEAVCFSKARSETRNQRSVNLCTDRTFCTEKNSDITTAVVEGIPMDVLIDSGALNVSLISSDVLKYLPCQPKHTHCTLKGISDNEIVATSYVTVVIEFSKISIEADLIVVPAACMNTPIIIGTDILNRDGVTYVRTKHAQYLTRDPDFHLPANIHTIQANRPEINTPLLGIEREALMSVIGEFSEFLITGTAASTVKTGQMEIKLTSPTPVVYRPYKLSYQEKLKVREMTNDLLDKGIIKKSQSEYASPIILVKKRDGSDRLCVDYRALNRITVKERYPLPLIDDQIDRLGNFEYFTSLDMATGFHQIPIKEECIRFTGFVTPEEHFEYVKMPFGLANSPIVYQRIINDTLRSHLNDGNVLVYVDDVLLLSNAIADGLELLRKVLFTLTSAGFSINLRKCSFLTTEIEYLGRVISRGQVKPSPRKVEALTNTSPPTTVKQVRQFLGLAGYFRRYIQGYAIKTACIAHLTRKGTDFNWGPEQEQVRQDLIQQLTSEPVLCIFDPQFPTEVHTDASSAGYGAVLLQTRPDGKKHAVAYFSKVTQGAESKYHSYELETLAVVKALQHFRHYLVGLKFLVVTDCNALKSTEKKKDLLPRVARWWMYLQDFDFTIEYRKGAMMQHADYLSRNPPLQVNQISRPRNWAQIAQAADNETQDLLQKLQEGNLDSARYVSRNDLLYYKYTPVGEEPRLLCFIPKGHRLSLLRVFHDEHEHIGAEKTMDLILKHFWFPGLRHFVRKYVAHCLICLSHKRVPRAPLQNITSWEKPDTPFNTVHVDALGPLPLSESFKFVLIIVDGFSKFTLLYPICRQDVSELKRVMTQAVALFGVPKVMVTDKGRMFESNEFIAWTNGLGCEMHFITPEMHHANGQVERYVRTVLNMIRVEANHKKASWSESLWKLQLVLNITTQKTTQTSALNLLIGTDATTPLIRALVRDVAVDDARPNRDTVRELSRDRARQLLRKNQTSQDASANRHREPPRQFRIGDLVFVIKISQSTGKLDSGMRGPYKVINVLPSGRYTLKLLAGGYGKTSQAAAQFMVPWRGEWCPETCAAFFGDDDSDDDSSAGPSAPPPKANAGASLEVDPEEGSASVEGD